jgi:hypothetical protein
MTLSGEIINKFADEPRGTPSASPVVTGLCDANQCCVNYALNNDIFVADAAYNRIVRINHTNGCSSLLTIPSFIPYCVIDMVMIVIQVQ